MARFGIACAALSLLALPALAQDDADETAGTDSDLTLPPRLENEIQPGNAQLEPPDEEREDILEAVVTGGQNEFRLPDLGTSFRDDEDERDPNARMEVRFLNLYDPDNIDPAEEAFPSLEEKLGVGMLRVFRIGFGDRDRN